VSDWTGEDDLSAAGGNCAKKTEDIFQAEDNDISEK
jgi:hypothetical protein